ncbi:MAG: c-type cytochrome [Anaerolineales bacterium]
MVANRLKEEWLAVVLILVLALGLPAGIFLWGQRSSAAGQEIQAAMPEKGGWAPDTLHMQAGEPLTLRLTSDDVVHGFAVGKQDLPAVDVLPGEVTEITLTFDEPGKYVYYCTRWCGPDHWRMRGTIIVEGAQQDGEPSPPLYTVMGFDLDAERTTEAIPDHTPSIQAGRQVMNGIEVKHLAPYRDEVYLKTHSPARVWEALRAEPFTAGLSDGQIWDLVAALWRTGTSTEDIAKGQQLYAQNCAACHGTEGTGEGVFANQLPSRDESDGEEHLSDTVAPADFTDAEQMLATNDAILQGKIIRGGMGTGMPYFGPIFTEEQT